jgi:hypothetical protein
MTNGKAKFTKTKAAALLAAVAEKHLATMPEEERERSLAAFAARDFPKPKPRRTR